MARETELERLIVRFVGDASSYMKMMAEVQQSMAEQAKKAKEHENALKSLQEKIEGLGATLAKVFGAAGVAFEFKELVEGAEHWEESMVRLEAVVKANGEEVERTVGKYKAFREEMFEHTRANRMEIQGLIEQAETFGLTGERAEKAVKEAMAASKVVKDASAEMLLGFSQAMARSDLEQAEHYKRQIRQLRGATTEQEMYDKWQRIVAAGTEVMGKEMETAAAKVDKARQRMKQMEVQLGAVLVEGIKPLADWTGRQAEAFGKLDASTQQSIAQSAALAVGLIAVNEAGGKVLSTLTALARNPLAWVVAAAAAAYIYTQKTIAADEATKKFKESVDDLDRALAKRAGQRNKAADKFYELNVDNPDALQKQIEENNKQIERLIKQKSEMEKLASEADYSLKRGAKRSPMALLEEMGKMAAAQLDDIGAGQYTSQAKAAEDEIARLKAENEKFAEGAKQGQDALAAKAESVLVKLRRQETALFENNQQWQLMDMWMKGLDPSMLDVVLARLEKVNRLQREQAAFQGLKGIQEQLNAEELANRAKANDDFWFNAEIEKFAKDMPKASEFVQYLRERNKQVKMAAEAQQILEGLETPEEKFARELSKLNQMLLAGLLTWDKYAMQVQKVRDQIVGATAAISNATLAGSNAARLLLYEQSQKMRGAQFGMVQGMLPPGAQAGPMPKPAKANMDDIAALLAQIRDKLGNVGADI